MRSSTCGEDENTYILLEIGQQKTSTGRSRDRWDSNIKIDLINTKCKEADLTDSGYK
jgi:hypothetical protein